MPELLLGESLEASLTVANLEHSAAWYTTVLGFSEGRRFERDGRLFAVSLKAGAVRLLLTQDDGTKGADRAKGVGMSFQITTHQDADVLAAAIKAHGVSLDTEPMTAHHGARIFRVRDPDGFRFTFSSTPA